MEEYKNNSEKEKFKGCQLEELHGCSEGELLKEFKEAIQLDDSVIPKAPEREADIIWNRIMDERSGCTGRDNSGKIVRGRFSWRKVAAVGLIACMLTGGGCFVAMGTKSYFYREKAIGLGNETVLVNDSYIAEVNGENDAYIKIENELGIKSLKLIYVPSEMEFKSLEIRDGYAFVKFELNGKNIFLIQAKQDNNVSYKYNDDSEVIESVYNKWLKQSFHIQEEKKTNGSSRFDTSIVIDGAYYSLSGTVEKDEFIKIIERLAF